MRTWLALGVLLSWLAGVASARTQTAQIVGIIRDAAGLARAGAKVTLTSETTPAAQSTVTQADGKFAFISVGPGRYKLTVDLAGFRREVRPGVMLENSQHSVTMDFTLVPDKYSGIPLYDQPRMRPSEVNTAIDYGGHSSSGPATTNTLVQGMSGLKTQPTSTNSSLGVGHAAPTGADEDRLFDEGNRLLVDQKFEPAIDVFSRAAARYPRSMKLRIGLGVALYARARYQAAVKTFCAASDLSPSDPRPYFFLARLGDGAAAGSPEVTKRLDRYLTLQPQSALAHYYYAMSLWRAQQVNGQVNVGLVESRLKRAIALDATLSDAHLALGDLYFYARNYPKAIREYQQAIRLQPDLAQAHYRLAQAYSHSGEKTLAQQEIEVHARLSKGQAAESARGREEMQRLIDSAKETPKP